MWLRLKVCYLSFHKFCLSLMNAMNFIFGCTGVHDDIDTWVGLCQVVQGEPSTGFGDDDDDEQIVQCLQHVKRYLILLWHFACLIS
jgi:hypothetical protein